MKKISTFITGILLLSQQLHAQLRNEGARIVMQGSSSLVLDNLGLQNNGVFVQSAGTVKFSGNADAIINGSVVPQFYNFELAKNGAQVRLQTGVFIHNQLSFTNGLIDLNNQNIVLAPVASLAGESEASHIIGPLGGYVEVRGFLNAPSAVNLGNLGAVITSGQDLGSVAIRRGHKTQANGNGLGNSILRYYDILVGNNTNLNATLRFNYLDAELNSLNENTLVMWKTVDTSHWSNEGFTNKDVAINYVEKTGINDFSRWTLSTINNALPLVWGSFYVQCRDGRMLIGWKTLQESNTASFAIQHSSNGRDWTDIATLPAAGISSSPLNYSYSDVSPLAGKNYYRILQLDVDGKKNYSAVFSGSCDETESLKAFPNPVQNDLYVVIETRRKAAVAIRLFDSKGALISQRVENILPGSNQLSLPMQAVAQGVYSLVVRWGDGTSKMIKIQKQ
jgi:hypothetical protein